MDLGYGGYISVTTKLDHAMAAHCSSFNIEILYLPPFPHYQLGRLSTCNISNPIIMHRNADKTTRSVYMLT